MHLTSVPHTCSIGFKVEHHVGYWIQYIVSFLSMVCSWQAERDLTLLCKEKKGNIKLLERKTRHNVLASCPYNFGTCHSDWYSGQYVHLFWFQSIPSSHLVCNVIIHEKEYVLILSASFSPYENTADVTFKLNMNTPASRIWPHPHYPQSRCSIVHLLWSSHFLEVNGMQAYVHIDQPDEAYFGLFGQLSFAL